MTNNFTFAFPLLEGLILKRRNRFIMEVTIEDTLYDCHCPTTGRIGNIVLENIPCLLSPSEDSKRKTPFTVEAFSLNEPKQSNKNWIGINQNAVNRYVEHFLKNGGFSDMVDNAYEVQREKVLGNSKLDFLIGNTYLEVKTPLQQLQIDMPEHIKTKKLSPFDATDRMLRHIRDLADSLASQERAILLTCFIYDNPGFQVVERSVRYEQVKAAVQESEEKGVERWQANFTLSSKGVSLCKYFRLPEVSTWR